MRREEDFYPIREVRGHFVLDVLNDVEATSTSPLFGESLERLKEGDDYSIVLFKEGIKIDTSGLVYLMQFARNYNNTLKICGDRMGYINIVSVNRLGNLIKTDLKNMIVCQSCESFNGCPYRKK